MYKTSSEINQKSTTNEKLSRTGAAVLLGTLAVTSGLAGSRALDDQPVKAKGQQVRLAETTPLDAGAKSAAEQVRAAKQAVADAYERTREVQRASRSEIRQPIAPAPTPTQFWYGTEAELGQLTAEGQANARLGYQMTIKRGWSIGQVACLDHLWTRESGWRIHDTNPSSGAYGIPQSLPPEKMAAAGDDWQTNPATQIAWGLDYIAQRYGTPCEAWQHSQNHNWY